MKKLLKKLKSNTGWLVAGGLVVLAAGSVFAFTGTGSTVIENAENVTVQGNCDLVEEVGLGAASDYCDGTEATTNLCVVDIYTLTSSGSLSVTGTATFSGSQTTISATSTISRLDATQQIDMTWNTTTYSDDIAVNAPTVNVRVENTGSDMWCYPPVLDISDALVSFGGSYRIGTTTAISSSALTNTTTATLMELTAIASTTDTLSSGNIPWSSSNHGTGTFYAHAATGTPWLWGNAELLVVSMAGAGGATSSNSISAAGAFDGAGKLHVNCWNRY